MHTNSVGPRANNQKDDGIFDCGHKPKALQRLDAYWLAYWLAQQTHQHKIALRGNQDSMEVDCSLSGETHHKLPTTLDLDGLTMALVPCGDSHACCALHGFSCWVGTLHSRKCFLQHFHLVSTVLSFASKA